MVWFYLSFAEESPPDGRGFLGAAIVDAPNDLLAVVRAHTLGINPGGEVVIIKCASVPPPSHRLRLLSRAEIEDMDAHFERVTEASPEGWEEQR